MIFVMRDVVYLDQIEQAEALLKPQRIDGCDSSPSPGRAEVAVELDQTPQRVYYHVKRLLEAGLVRQVAERRCAASTRGSTRRPAGPTGCPRTWSAGSGCARPATGNLGYLLDLMEDVQADVAALDLTRPDLPSIGVSGHPGTPGAAHGVPRRTAADAAGPVHPLRRCRRRRVPSGRRLLSEGRSR